jgi:hypothetical protein
MLTSKGKLSAQATTKLGLATTVAAFSIAAVTCAGAAMHRPSRRALRQRSRGREAWRTLPSASIGSRTLLPRARQVRVVS